VQAVREAFIPQGMIISNVGAEPVVYDLEAFIAPGTRAAPHRSGARPVTGSSVVCGR
jgi:hypothetical protein